MGAPTVSLIMAAHEPDADYFRLAVETALEQVGVEHEVVVVDDGSSEPLAGLLDRPDHPALRLLRIEHGGESRARNVGIEASTGSHLRLIDADDALPPGSTRDLLALIEGTEATVACGATRFCRSDLTPIRDMRAGLPAEPLIPHLLLWTSPMLFSMLIPREVALAAGPWDEKLVVGTDWDFILRLFEHADVIETSEPMVWYRQHPRQASSNREEAWRGTVLGLERFLDRHPELRGGPLERRGEAMLDYMTAELAAPSAPWTNRALWRGLRKDPGLVRTLVARQLRPRLERARMLVATRPDPFPG